MNKKTIKIITTILAIILLVGFIGTTVMAANSTGSAIDPGSLTATYDPNGINGITTIAGRVMGFIRNIAIVGGVIMLMVLGVKYMLGSSEEKAGYQKSLVPLIVGILVVMSATTIMTWVVNMFTVST